MSLFRINQAIAKSGLCSRRQADTLIASGKVFLNGAKVEEFNTLIDPDRDQIAVDGQPINIKKFVYIALHKPKRIITSCNDDQGRKTVIELLPPELRYLSPVGRLDYNSEGLILLTNDGELTQKITHPSHHKTKRYIVTVKGYFDDKSLKTLSTGMMLEDGPTQATKVKLKKRDELQSIFEITLIEGRNRQIRRMCLQLGYSVSRLVRVAIGELQLGVIPLGAWRYLSVTEIESLKN